MDKSRKIATFLLIIMAAGFSVYFFVSPFLGTTDQAQGPESTINQTSNNNSVSTLTNDIDSCITTPSTSCDQEMLQIVNYCKNNKDQPVCSDARVAQYVDQHGLDRPTVNTGK